ncbi:hypothetical protein [Kineococcus rubinsiae]|uniref:hypothetical protein n=1 Tax=Kineococcus rubinsiae TaxID=2609562 RepID=UPI0014303997|nr:hypothetical protein [Kineococcus rubinsiae]NIZ90139.1 hypothetical protein [Kineococcus rubinsiae]
MSEQDDALHDLGESLVLEGLRWAAASSANRVLSDYDAETGHDQGWLGYSHHKLMKDRMDRVFSCGKYAAPSVDESAAGLDVVGAGLSQEDLRAMPQLASDLVVREDLNGSPGWRFGEWRWLLASFRHGEAHRIQWTRKSLTKQRVAAQRNPDQLAFDDEQLGIAELTDVFASLSQLTAVPSTTLVLGHALDPFNGGVQLPLGRPRLNPGGTEPWYWMKDLVDDWQPGGRGRVGSTGSNPSGSGGPDLPDAPIRLRRRNMSASGGDSDQ